MNKSVGFWLNLSDCNCRISGLSVGPFRDYPLLQIILILLLSFVLNIKTNPARKINTIGIANNIAIKRPASVSSAPINREKGIAIKDMTIPIIIRIMPATFRILFGIKSRMNSVTQSNNNSPITIFSNC